MLEYLMGYKEELFRVISIFVISMAAVYALGRMLGILKTNLQKNILALISVISLNASYSYYFSSVFAKGIIWYAWEVGFYSSLCVLAYVLLGFKLYDRADDFLDKKIGKDKK